MAIPCPKCATPSRDGSTCPRCGLVFARWSANALPMAPLRASAAPSRSPARIAAVALLLAAVGAGALVLSRSRGAVVEPEQPDALSPAPLPDEALPLPDSAGELAEATPPQEPLEADQAPPAGPRRWPVPRFGTIRVASWPDPVERGHVPSDWRRGASGHSAALSDQEDEHVPLLLLVATDWCPVCKRLEGDVLPHSAVREVIAPLAKARINPDESPEEKQLARSLGVTGFPSLYLQATRSSRPLKVSTGGTPEQFSEYLRGQLRSASRQLSQRGEARLRAGDPAGAVGELNGAVSVDPADGRALYLRGRAYATGGAFREALADLEAAIDQDGDLHGAREALAIVLLEQDELARSEAALDELLARAPGHGGGSALYLRGAIRARDGRLDAALADAGEACRAGYQRACGLAR